jgi:bacteriorhodopsin
MRVPSVESLSLGQFDLVSNAFSFTMATMGAATLFFWFGRSQVAEQYKTALTVTGLVTAIAAYHYFRISISWHDAFIVDKGVVTASGVAFNDAYRYVDWLLTVPLLLIELILVMNLGRAETVSKSLRLGGLAALMIVLGYPGEVSDGALARVIWGLLSMMPFIWIVRELFIGLKDSVENQPADVRGLVDLARWVVVVSWSFYPVVYFSALIGFGGGASETVIQVGYTIADIAAKAAFGLLIYAIAVRKSAGAQSVGGVAAAT